MLHFQPVFQCSDYERVFHGYSDKFTDINHTEASLCNIQSNVINVHKKVIPRMVA